MLASSSQAPQEGNGTSSSPSSSSSDADWALSSHRVVGNQLVFRVKGTQASNKKAPQKAKEDRETQSVEPVYHARRPHRKSRMGCANCKRRRVKCDETKPKCQKCESYGISCDYAALQVRPRQCYDQTGANPASQILYSSFQPGTTDLASRIEEALRMDPAVNEKFPGVPISSLSKSVDAFQHFIRYADANATSEAHRQVSSGPMMRFAFQTPYLMHAILGVAMTHLGRMLPHEKSFKPVEEYHWGRAIRLYQHEITQPIGPHNMDPLMSTCMLLSVLSFSAEEYKPSGSFVFSSDPTALNWLLVQCGLRYLIRFTGPYLCQSIWWDVFKESNDEKRTFDDHRPGNVDLHPGLAQLCEIGETTCEETSPYHWPLRMLSPMLRLDPTGKNLNVLNTWMGRLLPDYTNLLVQKDPRALLIFSYWLAKMCEVKQWWINSRVHSECVAICMYLENSEDMRILELLEYPAEKCGYLLRHVREQAVFEANIDLIGLF